MSATAKPKETTVVKLLRQVSGELSRVFPGNRRNYVAGIFGDWTIVAARGTAAESLARWVSNRGGKVEPDPQEATPEEHVA